MLGLGFANHILAFGKGRVLASCTFGFEDPKDPNYIGVVPYCLLPEKLFERDFRRVLSSSSYHQFVV
jgi:hypothetical protein